MPRPRTITLKEYPSMDTENEALWALLGVFSLTLIFQLIERGYV